MPEPGSAPFERTAVAEPRERRWMRTYIAVIAVEILVLLGLWWLQSHFGI